MDVKRVYAKPCTFTSLNEKQKRRQRSCAASKRNGENYVNGSKYVPLFDGTKAKIPAWKQNFLCLAKRHDLSGIFTDGVDVPVADETMSIAALKEAFPRENIQNHFIVRNIPSRTIITDNADRDTLRHASSPVAGWRALVDTYSASTLGFKVQCLQSLTSRRVKPDANPIPVFDIMIEDVHKTCVQMVRILKTRSFVYFSCERCQMNTTYFVRCSKERGRSLPSTVCVRSNWPGLTF